MPADFSVSPSVQDWIRQVTEEKRDALTALLMVLKDHFLPGGSLLRISQFKEPAEIPASFTVPFDEGRCLLLYELPIRADEPIRLLLILDPYSFPSASSAAAS
jgi:hypothetical protein